VAGLLVVASACAQTSAARAAIQARATVDPAAVQLGQPTRYQGRLIVPASMTGIRWLPPEPNEDFTWGELAPRRVRGKGGRAGEEPRDTLEVEATLQVFRLGEIAIPGLRFTAQEGGRTRIGRLPLVRLRIASMMTAADTNARLRPLRGPLAAPWWERVPWTWVVLGIVALGAVAALIMWWRRRKPRELPVAAPVHDPAATARLALAALRRLDLPAHGRFAEHTLHLSRIARRFLEETSHTPRPGDTTPELLGHLEGAALRPADLERLGAVLRIWDQVKFARASSSIEEAKQGEQVVEELVRRWTAPEPTAKVA
jgi:hypothetical protein